MNHTRYACHNLSLPSFPQPQDPCWETAPVAALQEVESGQRPFLYTELRLLRDDAQGALFVRFVGEDDGIRSTYRLHDETLYTQDVFELFLADSDGLDHYKEIQVSPWDLTFTGTIDYPGDGRRLLDMRWDIPGMRTRTRYNREAHQTVSIWKLPYAAFAKAPAPGGSWRFNAFRIDHSARGEELQAWQHTGARNFHVPERFGWLDFTA